MSANSFGRFLTMTTFGESHGPGLGVVLDGVPPGLVLDVDRVQEALDRRRPGTSSVTSPRSEANRLEVLSGLYESTTTGAPLTMLFRNKDVDSSKYVALKDVYRPGHADFTYHQKYGLRDPRGGGRSSGRETVARVAAGAVASQILAPWKIHVRGWVAQVGDVVAEAFDPAVIDANPVRCPDPAAAEAMVACIEAAKEAGDSVGGRIRVRAERVPVGLGDPVFAKLDAALAGALMSIGGVKAVEIGPGAPWSDGGARTTTINGTARAFCPTTRGACSGASPTVTPWRWRCRSSPRRPSAAPSRPWTRREPSASSR